MTLAKKVIVELGMGGLLFWINIAETVSWIILYFQPLIPQTQADLKII